MYEESMVAFQVQCPFCGVIGYYEIAAKRLGDIITVDCQCSESFVYVARITVGTFKLMPATFQADPKPPTFKIRDRVRFIDHGHYHCTGVIVGWSDPTAEYQIEFDPGQFDSNGDVIRLHQVAEADASRIELWSSSPTQKVFAIGDQVRVTEQGKFHNHTGIITGWLSMSNEHEVTLNGSGHIYSFVAEDLQYISHPVVLRVGDKVKVLDENSDNFGCIARIAEWDVDEWEIRYNTGQHNKYGQLIAPGTTEHVFQQYLEKI